MLHLIQRVYHQLLWFYPRHFRCQFADEMEYVFEAMLENAVDRGHRHVVVFIMRELRQLPVAILYEHWITGKEMVIKMIRVTDKTSSLAGWGALSFGVAIAIAKSASYLTSTLLERHAAFIVSTLAIILAGAVGGVLFGLAYPSRERTASYALIGALVLSLGFFLVSISEYGFVTLVSPQSGFMLLSLVIEPLILGFAAGIMAGYISKNWKFSLRLGLIGVGGFLLGTIGGFALNFVLWGITQAIDSYRPGFDGQLSPWVNTLSLLMKVIGVSILSGVVGGVLLGMKVKPHHLDREPQVSA